MKHLKTTENFNQKLFENDNKTIKDMSNHDLLSHFKDAICDSHYNPSNEDYNESGYSLYELKQEILSRMRNVDDEQDNY